MPSPASAVGEEHNWIKDAAKQGLFPVLPVLRADQRFFSKAWALTDVQPVN
jgi:hypothetical protein